jgi:hypothetical protein
MYDNASRRSVFDAEPDMPELTALKRWVGTSTSIEHIMLGMERQGYAVSLRKIHDEGWAATDSSPLDVGIAVWFNARYACYLNGHERRRRWREALCGQGAEATKVTHHERNNPEGVIHRRIVRLGVY